MPSSLTDPTPTRGALTALVALLLPEPAGGPAPERLAGLLDAYLQRVPAHLRLAVRGAAVGLDALARASGGARAADLDLAARQRLLDRLAAREPTALGIDGVKALVLLVHGADDAAAELLSRAAATAPARHDAPLDVTPAAHWPSRSRADAVVVGSGAGGAIAARALARRGLRVVVVEEGRRFALEEFRSRHPLERWTELYRDAGTTMALGRPPILLPLGRAVGGSTVVNSGTSLRPHDAVLRRWRDEHGVALAAPERLTADLDAVERALQVAPVPDAVMGRNGELALAGADLLGWQAGPMPRNAPGCAGSCQCALGCPTNAKNGVHLSVLPDACAAGARIVSEARVRRLRHSAGRVTGVEAQRPDGSTLTVDADRVVVAAGATETPPLLWRSGLGGHPELGRNLALHPAVGVSGRFDEAVVPWRGVLQSALVDELHHDHGITIEATAMPPGMGSIGLPGLGAPLVRELDRAAHYATLGAMIADAPSGRVRRVAGRTVTDYRLAGPDGHRLMAAVAAMGRLLLAAGAREVVTGLPGAAPARSVAELDAVLGDADPRRLHLTAFHPTGTARMGADPQRHPVTAHGALRGARGVAVADASALPTCPEVNPQLAIMAVAAAISREGVPA